MAESTSAARSHEIENKAETTVVHTQDHGDRSSASTNGHGVPEVVGGAEDGAVRNRKREWFAYVKTKQFWVVLVLGYGHLPHLQSRIAELNLYQQTNPRPLYNRHEYLVPTPRLQWRQHPRLPSVFQLRPPQHRLDWHHTLQIWIQGLVQNGQDAWVEVPHPLLL